MLSATTAYTFSTCQLPKVVRTWCVLCILTWKCAPRRNGVHLFNISTSKSGLRMVCLYILTWECASRRNGVHFFNISTSKSAPNMRCFQRFHLQMCFARRAIFHLSSGQIAPHPPLSRAYLSTLLGHKTLEKHSVSRLSYLFAHLDLLSSDCLFFDLLPSSLLFSSLF